MAARLPGRGDHLTKARNHGEGEKMKTRITVADLKDQINTPYPRAFLKCLHCGAEYSANAGDYWDRPLNHVFKCCGRNMRRVTESTVYHEA